MIEAGDFPAKPPRFRPAWNTLILGRRGHQLGVVELARMRVERFRNGLASI